jgi:arylsulfatase A-like enzyme
MKFSPVQGLRVVVAAAVICAGAWAFYELSSRQPAALRPGLGHPNVLVVMWDTVRADRLSAYGYEKPTTPRLAEFARSGSLFEQVISPAIWTLPSHASLFTGLPVSAHGATASHKWIDSSFPKLAELFRDAGYDTYMFSSNPFVSDMTNSAPGFETVDYVWETPWNEKTAQAIRAKLDPRDRSNALAVRFNLAGLGADPRRLGITSADLTQSGPVIKEAFEHWLDRRDSAKPFFAFLNYMEAHYPRLPSLSARLKVMTPAQVDRSFTLDQDHTLLMDHMFGRHVFSEEDLAVISGVYDASLIDLDAATAQLFDMLEDRGLLDETVVLLTSDHGENLGEHGLMEHKYNVYNTVTRVPLVVRYPPRVPAQRVFEPVSALDIHATLLDLAGIPPPQPATHSISLFAPPELRAGRGFFISEMLAPASRALRLASKRFPDFDSSPWMRRFRAVEMDGLKFIRASDGRRELYDLATDPQETNNLYSSSPERAEPLERTLDQWMGSFVPYKESKAPVDRTKPLTEEELKRLRALGYAQS